MQTNNIESAALLSDIRDAARAFRAISAAARRTAAHKHHLRVSFVNADGMSASEAFSVRNAEMLGSLAAEKGWKLTRLSTVSFISDSAGAIIGYANNIITR